jgi:hypothetical protein
MEPGGMPESVIGVRLPDATLGAPGPGWDAWERRQPGAYMRVDFGERVGWYVCDPTGKTGLIGAGRRRTLERVADLHVLVEHPPVVHDWEITEHDDGTISVQPSIMDPGGWHGFLDRGVWTAA